MKINIELSVDSINKAIKQLEAYRDSLQGKCAVFVQKLYEKGYSVATSEATKAMQSLGGGMISIVKEQGEEVADGYSAIMLMFDTTKIQSSWLDKDGNVKTAIVSPTLMAEFGSGSKANTEAAHMEVVNVRQAVGRGTFPGQTHAFEKMWHWKDLNGVWHTSSGVKPTMPLYHAYIAMIEDCKQIAREVFKE